MKLRNKKTGKKVDLLEIVRLNDISDEFYLRLFDNEGRTFKVGFNSLTELNEEWEDYEELKEHWCITMYGGITRIKDDEEPINDLIEIGNYFNSKEDAYDALYKIKVWKRLKDRGFRVIDCGNEDIRYEIKDRYDGCLYDLETVFFGGEE